MEIEKLRKDIDSIDSELTALFCKRMETAGKIAEHKKKLLPYSPRFDILHTR